MITDLNLVDIDFILWVWVKSGSAKVWDVDVLTGKKREILILRDMSRFFTRLQPNRANICNGYNAGVCKFTYSLIGKN